jgi:SNF2 family DNA or RNA helicase
MEDIVAYSAAAVSSPCQVPYIFSSGNTANVAASSAVASKRSREEDYHVDDNPPGLITRIVPLTFNYEHEIDLYKQLEILYGDDPAVSETDAELITKGRGNEEEIINGNSTNSFTNGMEAILRMRQACAHPLVFVRGIQSKLSKTNTKGGNVGYSSLFSRASSRDEANHHARIVEQNEKNRRASKTLVRSLKACKDIGKSTKMDFVIRSILDHRARNPPHHSKVLVFCEWLHEISILSDALTREGERGGPISKIINFTGKLTMMEKASNVREFERCPDACVMLVQLRTGGTGLNLQAASKVIITSPSWNPCNDLQAMCRAYRKGQRNIVECERLVISGTIDEKCLKVQRGKMDCLDELFEEETFASRMGFV